MIKDIEDTIVAISTPPGYGGIAIIRLSGNRAVEISDKIFRAAISLADARPWRAILGKIVDGTIEIDEVVAILYRKPNSYTREDMVEINCHGGRYVSQRIVELAIKNGARLAEPGEFTFRAFLNGRIDLSQAEAVADLIHAQTEASLLASYSQLKGNLSQRIQGIKDQLVNYCSLLELELDFAEEDVEFVERADFVKRLEKTQRELDDLMASYKMGRLAREGVKLVIAGKPNVGKSSLLNRLAREERAIVTEIPGTTRDPLEVQLDINGVLFRVFDTAGIKDSEDVIEKEGIRRARSHLNSADIIVHVFDGSQKLGEEDYEIMRLIKTITHATVIRAVNKIDLPQQIQRKQLDEDSILLCDISATRGDGIDQLERACFDAVIGEDGRALAERALVTNIRHWEALSQAKQAIGTAIQEASRDASPEFIVIYLRDALNYLGQIIGSVTSEDILNNIFSKFCIGK